MSRPATFHDLDAARARRDERERMAFARDQAILAAEAAREQVDAQLTQSRHASAAASLAIRFDPDPVLSAKLIEDIASAQCTLSAIAAQHRISLAALAAWMSCPEIAGAISALEQAIAQKQRLAAMTSTTHALSACTRIFMEYQQDESELAFDAGDLKAHKARCRARENALEASRVLLQLNKLFAPLPPASPALAGEVSERALASKDGGGMPPPPPASIPRSQDPSIPSTPAHRYPAKARTPEPLPESHPARLTQSARARSSPAGGGAAALGGGGGSISSPPSPTPSYGLDASPHLHPP